MLIKVHKFGELIFTLSGYQGAEWNRAKREGRREKRCIGEYIYGLCSHKKKKKMRHLFILTVLLLLFSCKEHKKRNDNLYKLKDSLNYSDLQIIYSYNENDYYFSSFDSTFSQRYVHETKSIKLFLSVEDKRKIYQVVKSADIFNLPDTFVNGFENCILPCFSKSITVQIRRLKKKIYFDGYGNIKDKDESKRFYMIHDTISSIIFKKEEVKKMPQSDIIYM